MLQKVKTFAYNILTNIMSTIIATVILGAGANVALVWSSFKTIKERLENNK